MDKKYWYRSSTGSYVRVEISEEIYEGDLVKVRFAGLEEPLLMPVDSVIEKVVKELPVKEGKFSDLLNQ